MLCINYYQLDEYKQNKFWLFFKMKLSEIFEIFVLVFVFEIFVYVLDIEGVYLCGGKVVCGGLCWFDC